MPAGKLIEQSGFKGLCMGSAQVSTVHANFFINIAENTRGCADDFLALMTHVKQGVWEKFQISLQTEVKIIGS